MKRNSTPENISRRKLTHDSANKLERNTNSFRLSVPHNRYVWVASTGSLGEGEDFRPGRAWWQAMAIVFALVCFPAFLNGQEKAANSQTKPATNQSSEGTDSKTTSGLANLSDADRFRAMRLTSKAFRAAVEKIRPSLVIVESYGGVSAVQGRIGGIRAQGEGNTTGIMISPDGYILTSTFNFIQQPPVISVITSDGERRFAKLLGRDDTRKICLLKIDGVEDMPVPETVDPDDLTVGQWALSLGVGYGDTSPAVSMGIISAKNRIGGRAIQTDANISPANYGGPLIDIQGRVLGVCVPMNPQSQAVGAGVEWYDSGIGFAIPLDLIQEVIARLKKGEKIAPGFLGIAAIPNPVGKGLFIERVVQETAAEEAGLLREDVLIEINGQPVSDMMRFKSILNRFEEGETVEITVLKDGTPPAKKLKVKLGVPPRPEGEGPIIEPPQIR